MQTKKPGYILVLTLMILSISTIVVTQIFYQGRLFNAFVPLIIEKEKARQIALAGIPIAIAQLSLQDAYFTKEQDKEQKESARTDQKGTDQKKPPKPTSKDITVHAKGMLKTLLTIQGRWQKFSLTYEADGIDAQLALCITCEDGKLNLNNLYDFKKHTFAQAPHMSIPDIFKTFAEASKKFTKNKNMFETIEETLKKRDDPLFDVTQVLDPIVLDMFRDYIFYVPADNPFATQDQEAKKTEQMMPRVFLADIFTVDTSPADIKINPWVLSPSLKKILGFASKEIANEDSFKKEMEEFVEKVKIDDISWKKDWDTYLKPLYGVDFQSLPKEIAPFLSIKFEPRLFSVLCYSKVGRVLQKLLVILERNATETGESILVRKFYWL